VGVFGEFLFVGGFFFLGFFFFRFVVGRAGLFAELTLGVASLTRFSS